MKLASPIWAAVVAGMLATAGDTVAAEIAGRIVDVTGAPITGASVSVNSSSSLSDENGGFRLTVDDAVIYRVDVTSDGYYSTLQTFSRADSNLSGNGNQRIALRDIVLVERQPNRRLLAFAGDTMMGRRFVTPRDGEPVLIRPDRRANDMQRILEFVAPYLANADLATVNLETQLADTELASAAPKSVVFFTHPDIVPALQQAGVDYVALGNNHTYDYLDEGLRTTLQALARYEMPFSGAGYDAAAARQPYVAELASGPVGLLSYVGWAGNFEPNQVAGDDKGGAAFGTSQTIAEDLAQIDEGVLAVVQLHGGLEYQSTPALFEETQLKQAIDDGADLAVGHHSHVLQGFEVYRDRLIAYSLGNFVFDQYLPSTHSAMLLYVWYDDDTFYRAEAIPLHVTGYMPTPATGQFRYDILQRLSRLVQGENTCLHRSGGHLVIVACDGQQMRFAGTDVVLPAADNSGLPMSLRTLNVNPLGPINSVQASNAYRLGVDLLRRGDFEYAELFGIADRFWRTGPKVELTQTPARRLKLRVEPGSPTASGMKVFTRVFTRSNPATLAGNISADGCGMVEFILQSRPDGVSFTDALDTGPKTTLLRQRFAAGSSTFNVDFQLPRTFTRSIRLLLNATACDDNDAPIDVYLDNIAIVDWQTPWLAPGRLPVAYQNAQATHIQVQAQ